MNQTVAAERHPLRQQVRGQGSRPIAPRLYARLDFTAGTVADGDAQPDLATLLRGMGEMRDRLDAAEPVIARLVADGWQLGRRGIIDDDGYVDLYLPLRKAFGCEADARAEALNCGARSSNGWMFSWDIDPDIEQPLGSGFDWSELAD